MFARSIIFAVSIALATSAPAAQQPVSPQFARAQGFRIGVSPTSALMKVGSSRRYMATYVNGGDYTPTSPQWSSSNTNVATVASDGTVRAVAAGKATIKATDGASSATSPLTVN